MVSVVLNGVVGIGFDIHHLIMANSEDPYEIPECDPLVCQVHCIKPDENIRKYTFKI